MKRYELTPQHATVKSFGHKAMVEMEENTEKLYSYDTLVAEITDGIATVYNVQSNTTVRHVKEFLLQNGFKAENKKQIEADYMK